MRHVDAAQSALGRRGRLPDRRLRRDHRIEQRKRIVAPTPRRNVRRGRCFFVMKAMFDSIAAGRVLLCGPGRSRQDPPYGADFDFIFI